MDLGLDGKVALITGGSRGIGRQIALAMGREGARLMLAARGAKALGSTAAEVAATGAEVATCVADFTAEEAPRAAVEATVARFGALDILICNAGGSFGARELSANVDADWEKTYRFNVLHSIAAVRAAIPHLSVSAAPSVIFIASISARAPAARGAQYAAAKAALVHAARSLAWEFGPQRIRVNAVSPGSTIFPGGGWERTRAAMPDEFAAFEHEDFPWGRLGAPEDIANVVAFVASPRAQWINGADIPVDGGQRRPSIR